MARTTNPNPLIIIIGLVLLSLGIAYAILGWVHEWYGLLLYSTAPIMTGFAMVLTETVVWREWERGRERRG
jgi:glucose dehydrogenase